MRLQCSDFYAFPKPTAALLAAMLALMISVGVPAAASAHPLGNFTVNRYSKLQVGAQRLQILYVLDMAEIPAHAERAQIDVDGDGKLSTAEVDRYRTAAAAALLQGVVLTVDGTVTPLELQTARLSFPAGQAGLPTLRLELTAHTPALQAGEHDVRYVDRNYADRLGWQEVIASAGPGATLAHTSVPAQDRSQELTKYPEDLLNDPPRVAEAVLRWQAGTGARVSEEGTVVRAPAPASGPLTAGAAPAASGRPTDPFADLSCHP